MKTIISILILSFAAVVYADSTEVDTTYFHPAASFYIHGNLSAASNLVVKGLSVFPDDGKLLRLKELIEKAQEQQQDQQNQDQQQQQNQDEQQQQNQDQQQEQDQQQDQQNEQQQDQQNQEQQNEQNQDQDQQQQQSEPRRAEQMTPDEAQQLMDAMKQEEQNKRMQLHPVLGAPVKVDKDW